MENINMSIGEVLKERRIELSVKQEDLAERMGVTVQTVSKWERGITEPKASQVADLAVVLKMNERDICQGNRKHSTEMEPFDFVKIIGACIRDVSETDLILTIYEHLDNPEDFAQALADKADIPFFTHNQREKEQAKTMMSLYENGAITFNDEAEKERCLASWKKIIDS